MAGSDAPSDKGKVFIRLLRLLRPHAVTISIALVLLVLSMPAELFPAFIWMYVVALLLGSGAGCFLPARMIPVSGGPSSVAVADLNGDGKPDLVVSQEQANSVAVLLQ